MVDLSFVLPLVSVVLVGGWLYTRGLASLGEVTTVALYVQLLLDPLDRLLSWLDELQVGASSLARLFGVAEVPGRPLPAAQAPDRRGPHGRRRRFSDRGRATTSCNGLDLAGAAAGERLGRRGRPARESRRSGRAARPAWRRTRAQGTGHPRAASRCLEPAAGAGLRTEVSLV
jgi:ABC-type multidrug transport system fused ATPase/permease subunit